MTTNQELLETKLIDKWKNLCLKVIYFNQIKFLLSFYLEIFQLFYIEQNSIIFPMLEQ